MNDAGKQASMQSRLCEMGILLLVVVPMLLGCGVSKHPELRSVSGTVTLDGNPVVDASVAFACEASSRLATGRTDEEGRFTLTSFELGDGAMPGEHRVAITKTDSADDDDEYVSMDDAVKKRPKQRQQQQLLPQVYASLGSTPLTVTVSENGESDLAIELRGDP